VSSDEWSMNTETSSGKEKGSVRSYRGTISHSYKARSIETGCVDCCAYSFYLFRCFFFIILFLLISFFFFSSSGTGSVRSYRGVAQHAETFGDVFRYVV
jgi:hypothetical protein